MPVSISKLSPWFVTGLIDGEGTFGVKLSKRSTSSIGYVIQLSFSIALHIKDIELIKQLKLFFDNAGSMSIYTQNGREYVSYKITSLKDIVRLIIPHFDNFPLHTQKGADYMLFKLVADLMLGKEHLTPVGFQNLLNIKASMNKGLNDMMQKAYPNTVPVARPTIKPTPFENDWVAGFVSAEGHFGIAVLAARKTSEKFGLALKFTIAQDMRDEPLMLTFLEFFGYGHFDYSRNTVEYISKDISFLYNTIIPFFDKHPVIGVKALDYADWKLAAELVYTKQHLTLEGNKKVIEIRNRMNSFRIN